MLNPLLDRLTDYPFDRLRTLLDGITPPAERRPLVLSVGEPRHPPPPLVAETLAQNAADSGPLPAGGGDPAVPPRGGRLAAAALFAAGKSG